MEEALADANEKFDDYMTVHNRFVLSKYELAQIQLQDVSKLTTESTDQLRALVNGQKSAVTNDEMYGFMYEIAKVQKDVKELEEALDEAERAFNKANSEFSKLDKYETLQKQVDRATLAVATITPHATENREKLLEAEQKVEDAIRAQHDAEVAVEEAATNTAIAIAACHSDAAKQLELELDVALEEKRQVELHVKEEAERLANEIIHEEAQRIADEIIDTEAKRIAAEIIQKEKAKEAEELRLEQAR